MIIEFLKLIGCIALCQLAGVIGSFSTVKSINGWYSTLNKPVFNPPNYIFAPVWTILYLLMGVSLYLIIKNGINQRNIIPVLIFAIQLFLNAIWSPIFFGAHLLLGSFIVIIFLWVAIFSTIILFYPLSHLAAYLLIPYFLWVSFAVVLNYSLFKLN